MIYCDFGVGRGIRGCRVDEVRSCAKAFPAEMLFTMRIRIFFAAPPRTVKTPNFEIHKGKPLTHDQKAADLFDENIFPWPWGNFKKVAFDSGIFFSEFLK